MPGALFEINLEMESGAVLAWQWNATGEVVFDVHTHFDGAVQVHAEATGTQDTGQHTTEQSGGISLLWQNQGDASTRIQYLVSGPFHVDSYHPPR